MHLNKLVDMSSYHVLYVQEGVKFWFDGCLMVG